MADEFTKAALYGISNFNKKVKEKIGIGKLIELLNEYDNGWDYDDYYGPYQYGQDSDAYHLCKYQLVSKEYGFIKWLVENDKIDREKFGNSETKSSKYSDFELSYDTPREDYTNTLLMELAIQDEPIQFLVKILR